MCQKLYYIRLNNETRIVVLASYLNTQIKLLKAENFEVGSAK